MGLQLAALCIDANDPHRLAQFWAIVDPDGNEFCVLASPTGAARGTS